MPSSAANSKMYNINYNKVLVEHSAKVWSSSKVLECRGHPRNSKLSNAGSYEDRIDLKIDFPSTLASLFGTSKMNYYHSTIVNGISGSQTGMRHEMTSKYHWRCMVWFRRALFPKNKFLLQCHLRKSRSFSRDLASNRFPEGEQRSNLSLSLFFVFLFYLFMKLLDVARHRWSTQFLWELCRQDRARNPSRHRCFCVRLRNIFFGRTRLVGSAK